jgi:hypothetical protein
MCSEADFQEWLDQAAWTAEKYRRFDRRAGLTLILVATLAVAGLRRRVLIQIAVTAEGERQT